MHGRYDCLPFRPMDLKGSRLLFLYTVTDVYIDRFFKAVISYMTYLMCQFSLNASVAFQGTICTLI